MFRPIVWSAVSIFLFVFNSSTEAATLDFTSGWTLAGDASITGSDLVNLSTDAIAGDDFDLGAGNGGFNFSGTPASLVGFGGLETFLGIDASQLDLGGIAYEGSAIATVLSVGERSELSFDWEFQTNETADTLLPGRGPFADYGFFLLDGIIHGLADPSDTGSGNCARGFDGCTIRARRTLILSPGAYTLAFGTIDIADASITSALSVGGVTLTPSPRSPVTVPEPSSFLVYLVASVAGITGKIIRRDGKKTGAGKGEREG
jgi:hypothetical protein